MPNTTASALAPVLAGHAFQQTALIAMIPLLAQQLGTTQSAIGAAVALGMIAAAPFLPFLGAMPARGLLPLALGTLLATNLALLALFLRGDAVPLAWVVVAVLAGLRFLQGLAAGAVLVLAQTAGAGASEPRRALGRVQALGGIGRALSAVLVGPLALLSPAVPLLPATFGVILGLARSRRLPVPRLPRAVAPPPLVTFRVTILAQGAVGAAQVGLAPLLAARLAQTADGAVVLAGLCLAAANLGLLLAARLIAPRAGRGHARLAALLLCLCAGGIGLAESAAAFAALSLLLGGAAALMTVLNLADILTRPGIADRQVAAWNGTVQIAALALGVGGGALLLPLDPAAPFALVAGCGLLLALLPPRSRRNDHDPDPTHA
ncbi:MFS transporter [Jannaschia marina]|uniref:hypothetical protein n=1 Tax=Jannaschia marina TaxID=2741674 RepID=UPI0015CBCF7E|nr:hypothetical protein [Jannaschia marina]